MSDATLHTRSVVEKPPELARPWTAARKTGYALVTLWIVLFIGFVIYL